MVIFFDTIEWKGQLDQDIIRAAYSYGYKGIVFNHVQHASRHPRGDNLKLFKCNDVSSQHDSPQLLPAEDYAYRRVTPTSRFPESKNNTIITMSRLTIVISSVDQVSCLKKSIEAGSFDLIAVTPQCGETWEALINQPEYDIMSLDLCSSLLKFQLKKQHIAKLLSRGVMFEVTYGQSICDPVARSNLFSNMHKLLQSLNSSQIVLSSGARQCKELRGPLDVTFFADMVGLRHGDISQLLSQNIWAIYYAAATKRAGEGVLKLNSKIDRSRGHFARACMDQSDQTGYTR